MFTTDPPRVSFGAKCSRDPLMLTVWAREDETVGGTPAVHPGWLLIFLSTFSLGDEVFFKKHFTLVDPPWVK